LLHDIALSGGSQTFYLFHFTTVDFSFWINLVKN